MMMVAGVKQKRRRMRGSCLLFGFWKLDLKKELTKKTKGQDIEENKTSMGSNEGG